MNLYIILIAALVCGAGNKYADLFNEHELEKPFKYVDHLWGIIWGTAGVVLVVSHPAVAVTYIATTLYWFLRNKLEYFNHALAGVAMLLAGFYFQSEYIMNNKLLIPLLFLGYTLTGYLQKYLKQTTFKLWWFWRLRLRIYLIPFVFSVIIGDMLPFIVTVVAMVGNEAVRYYFREYEDDSSLFRSQKRMKEMI